MRYEITDIAPWEGDGDVLVTVSYWYDNGNSAVRHPDWIEHHLILGIDLTQYPIINRLGQYLGVDNVLINPWVEVDGEWVRQEPDMSAVQHTTPDLESAILMPIDAHAREIFALRPTGGDLIPDKDIKTNKNLGHIARKTVVARNKGRMRQID